MVDFLKWQEADAPLVPPSMIWCQIYLDAWSDLVHGEMDRPSILKEALTVLRDDLGADPILTARAVFDRRPEAFRARYLNWPPSVR